MLPTLRSSLALALLFSIPALAVGASTSAKATPKAVPKASAETAAGIAAPSALETALGKAVSWRQIGPFRGGRSAAVTGIPGDPKTYYFGATGGGVWKTIDAGAAWKSVSDGFFGGSIGAVAVSEWDPNVIYVGGGEVTVRGNVSHGDGVWKSTDAGATWKHVGLADSRHIPRLRIHPKNPDLVYAAVLGHLFGPSEMRGVYRSKDGGTTWERILFVSPEVGAADLTFDPTNPRILYASTWRVRRTPYSLDSGGPGSGLWKSIDGGDHWTDLSGKKGMPKAPLGIIGVTVSPSDPQNVYAIVEAAEGGVFRSRDGGETWQLTSASRELRQRAWYYSRLYADPKDAEVVYVVNVNFHRSKDGGKTFEEIESKHGDHHDLWIAPEDPSRMILADDGGAAVSNDAGATWSTLDNQPTAQFYRVSTDNAFPFRLLGAQQDNSALRIRHRSFAGRGIGDQDWEPTAGGESGTILADPRDPDVIYGGSYDGLLVRINHRTGEVRQVDVWPDIPMGWGAAELRYRFQWNYPLMFSPHDPSVLYAGANVLFETRDEGATWRVISPDLTRNDKSKQGSSGGPITQDNTSIEYYGTIFCLGESPLEKGVLWTGSDDGLIHLSRDGGGTWKNVTPKGLPEWAQVNSLEPNPFEAGGLYVAATRYKSDDFRPYLYATHDWGATWTRIDQGIDEQHFTRVIRADPVKKGLLFAGTEHGVYASFDDGASWRRFNLNLPIVPITDLAIRDGILIAATQGRAFWALDDLALLRQGVGEPAKAGAAPSAPPARHLYTPSPVLRLPGGGRRGGEDAPSLTVGTDPAVGAVVYYRLDKAPEKPIEVAFLGADGKVLRQFAGEAVKKDEKDGKDSKDGKDEKSAKEKDAKEKKDPRAKKEPKAPAEVGLNRFVWDLRLEQAADFPGIILWNGNPPGPRVPPGKYQVRLTVDGEVETADFEVLPDPRSSESVADLSAQFDFLLGIRDKLSEVHRAILFIRDTRGSIDALSSRLEGDDKKAVREAADALKKELSGVEEALYQTKMESRQDPLNFPIRLNDKLAGVAGAAGTGDFPPTASAIAVRDELVTAIDGHLAKLRTIVAERLPAFEAQAREAGITLLPTKIPEPPAEASQSVP
ncbi:MAG TPA: glycosyl hydrolase [Thermoanaerobaculia bacterium]|jgi:photosystem II stability/assembly factor-like uncharacterized protein|nr:glycosyl hydrolase [Thermoanaerobaculia bacterium]